MVYAKGNNGTKNIKGAVAMRIFDKARARRARKIKRAVDASKKSPEARKRLLEIIKKHDLVKTLRVWFFGIANDNYKKHSLNKIPIYALEKCIDKFIIGSDKKYLH